MTNNEQELCDFDILLLESEERAISTYIRNTLEANECVASKYLNKDGIDLEGQIVDMPSLDHVKLSFDWINLYFKNRTLPDKLKPVETFNTLSTDLSALATFDHLSVPIARKTIKKDPYLLSVKALVEKLTKKGTKVKRR